MGYMYIAHLSNRAYILDVVYSLPQLPQDVQKCPAFSGGSRNFNTGERGPGVLEFLGSGVYFDAIACKPYVFVVRVGHMIYINIL